MKTSKRKLLVEKNLAKLKLVELGILKELDRVCSKNNIDYSLGFGTLLGAVKYGGFIPWDDDIDVIMTRGNYNKLLEVRADFSKKYFFQSKETDNRQFYIFLRAKLRDQNSQVEFGKDYNSGAFIDIFAIDGISERKIKRFIQKSFYLGLTYLNYSEQCPSIFRRDNKILQSLLIILFPITLLIKFCKPSRFFEKIYFKYMAEEKPSDYFFYHLKTIIMRGSDMFPLKKIKFEGHEFSSIKNDHEYLTQLYGKYMTSLPPEKDRVPGHVGLDKVKFGKTHKYKKFF